MSDPLSDPPHFRRLSELLDALLDTAPAERTARLAALVPDDSALRADVWSLLEAEDGSGLLDHGPGQGLLQDLATASEPSRAGERVGPYRIVRELGRGGMGVVYLAERADGVFEQAVAIKVVKPGIETDEVLARFERERQILARLAHPHVARLLDGGRTGEGRPYLVMEHVEGEPITAFCDARQLPVAERIRLFQDACAAVRHAHAHLVVHRDLKPSNIWVTGGGEVKLLDFGIAKLLSDEADPEARTRLGQRVMTLRYAAPEQVRGEAVTTATDVYALGLVLYELLSGRSGCPATLGPHEQERAILEIEPPPPSRAALSPAGPGDASPEEVAERRATTKDRLRTALEGDLDTVVLTALRKEPGRRYSSVEALVQDLERQRTGFPIQARTPTWAYRARRFAVRHRLAVAAAAAVAFAVVGGAGAAAWQARQKAAEARKAAAVKDFLVGIFKSSSPSEARGATISARELLDRGVARVEKELAGEPAVQAELLDAIGQIYSSLALYDAAEASLAKALALRRVVYGPDHLETARSMDHWGTLLWNRGRLQEADRVLREALALKERKLGRSDAAVAVTLSSLAAVASSLSHHEESAALHRRALEIDRRTYGDEHADVATDLMNLGVALRSLERFDEAEPLLRQGLALRRRLQGDGHPDTLRALHHLAAMLSARGHLEESEDLFREVVEGYRRVYGPDHPDLAEGLDGMGLLLQRRGRYDEALRALKDAVRIRERALGPEHLEVAISLNNLGNVQYRTGDLVEAEQQFRAALVIWEKTLDPGHLNIASALNNLGMIRRGRGDLTRAEDLLKRALDLRVRARGEESADVAQSRRNLGLVLMDRGRLGEAERELSRAWELSQRVYPADHPRRAEVAQALADLRLGQGRPAEAEPLLIEALRIRQAQLGADHPDTVATEKALQRCRSPENSRPSAPRP